MSGLLFLTSDDFKISRGTKGNILTTSIPGVSLILFYSTQCEHCKNLIPIFKKLPGTVGGCQFGMINVSNNKQCILMSRETIAPISFVPYIVLYINSRPYMRYQGPHQASEIGRFVYEVTQKIQNKQPFAKEEVKEDPRGGIPAYTIGKPLYGDDDVCYLEFSTAYNKGDGPSLVMRQNRK
jgi:thiol-disulfide isomerase/thioredoxin